MSPDKENLDLLFLTDNINQLGDLSLQDLHFSLQMIPFFVGTVNSEDEYLDIFLCRGILLV